MASSVRVVIATFGCIWLITGCGGGDSKAPKVAAAGGSVTYKGGALAGATVTFMPEQGPLAIGVTDMKGDFKLSSGALPGCAVGPAKVYVRVETPGESGSSAIPSGLSMEEQNKKMAAMTMAHQKTDNAMKKSLIPAKYSDPNSSGLSYTVDTDSSKNNFKIELKD